MTNKTEQLFQTDSYLREFSATIVDSDKKNRTLILDKTAFFPGGGGQLPDTGILSTESHQLKVVKLTRQKDQVLHWVEEDIAEIGSEVTGKLDWERRYKLMRTHTALHILCGVVWRDYGALVTGGNMEPLQGRMDFEFETLQQGLVKEIEGKINAEMAKSREIRVKSMPREEAFQIPDLIRTKINLLPEGIKNVRTVEIVGLDLQADGGTHVKNTVEVGHVQIVDYKSKGRINKRIYIELE